MNGLSCGEESMTIYSAVLIHYQRVTNGRRDRQTDRIAISIWRVPSRNLNFRSLHFDYNTTIRFVAILAYIWCEYNQSFSNFWACCSRHWLVLNAVIAFFVPPPKIGRKKFGGGRILFFRRIFGQPNYFSADFRRDKIFRRQRLNSAAEGSKSYYNYSCKPGWDRESAMHNLELWILVGGVHIA